ncbi:MAG: MFS transporter [Acidobacteria bacterium]|nr:MFS transporter [Acidobacteriota bacterium]
MASTPNGADAPSSNTPRSAFRISYIKLPRTVLALGLVSLFNDASGEIIYPLLPLFLTDTLGTSKTFVGLVEGVAESVSSLLKLPAGWYSDRLKKRKGVVLTGYSIASLIRPLLAIATAAWHVLALRFIDRLGKGLRSAPRDAMIADAAPIESRGLAFGFHRAMDHTGAIVGSLVAAWLVSIFHDDYRRIFWVAAIPGLVTLLILIFVVQEKPRELTAHQTTAAFSFDLSGFSPRFKYFLGVLFLFTLSNSSDAFLLLRAKEAGIQTAMIPILWAVLHVSKTVSSIIGGGLSDHFGRRKLIVSGWLVYAGIYLGFAWATSGSAMWALFIIYGFYFGLTEGVEKAFVADLVATETRGTAFGFYNLIIGVGSLPASLLLGFLWQNFGAAFALITSAGISLVATTLLIAFVPEDER